MLQSWTPSAPPDDPGVLVHGPQVLIREHTISAELDRVQAHHGGLAVHLRWHATGNSAATILVLEAARRAVPVNQEPTGLAARARPSVHVSIGDLAGEPFSPQSRASGSEGGYVATAQYWLNDAPASGVLRLTIAWPAVGVASSMTALRLDAAASS